MFDNSQPKTLIKYLIVGKSGTGKTFVANKLSQFGLSQVKSYTTRPKRTDNENNHIFITEEESKQFTDKFLPTTVNEYEYFMTKDQIKTSDICVIDLKGLTEILDAMPDTNFAVIYVKAQDENLRRQKIIERYESLEEAEKQFNEREQIEFDAYEHFDKIAEAGDFPKNVLFTSTLTNTYDEKQIEKDIIDIMVTETISEQLEPLLKEALDKNLLQYADDDTEPNNKEQNITRLAYMLSLDQNAFVLYLKNILLANAGFAVPFDNYKITSNTSQHTSEQQ